MPGGENYFHGGFSKKLGNVPKALSDATSFSQETFTLRVLRGTVFLVPEKLRLIGNWRG